MTRSAPQRRLASAESSARPDSPTPCVPISEQEAEDEERGAEVASARAGSESVGCGGTPKRVLERSRGGADLERELAYIAMMKTQELRIELKKRGEAHLWKKGGPR